MVLDDLSTSLPQSPVAGLDRRRSGHIVLERLGHGLTVSNRRERRVRDTEHVARGPDQQAAREQDASAGSASGARTTPGHTEVLGVADPCTAPASFPVVDVEAG